jgi:hypothetical protein
MDPGTAALFFHNSIYNKELLVLHAGSTAGFNQPLDPQPLESTHFRLTPLLSLHTLASTPFRGRKGAEWRS